MTALDKDYLRAPAEIPPSMRQRWIGFYREGVRRGMAPDRAREFANERLCRAVDPPAEDIFAGTRKVLGKAKYPDSEMRVTLRTDGELGFAELYAVRVERPEETAKRLESSRDRERAEYERTSACGRFSADENTLPVASIYAPALAIECADRFETSVTHRAVAAMTPLRWRLNSVVQHEGGADFDVAVITPLRWRLNLSAMPGTLSGTLSRSNHARALAIE